MTKTEFQEAMHFGLGRAILYARDNHVQPFRDVILDACLHSRGVDPQCEGARADYMFELVNILADRQFYFDEVLRALPKAGDDWDAMQLFRFAACMVFDGDERAKKVMYESFEPGPNRGEGIAINFVQMDDLKGFLFAASKLGALLLADPGSKLWANGEWPMSVAIENCGEEETNAALLEAAATDTAIAAYRAQIAKYAEDEPSREVRAKETYALRYDQLRSKLSGSRAALTIWGKHASDAELERAAHGLLSAQTPEEQIQHLPIFRWRPFPLGPSGLIELCLSQDERLGCAAADALTQIAHPSIREAAFRLIRDRLPAREHAIEMLNRNFEPNDHEVAMNWFETETDSESRHRMEMDLQQLWKDHPEPASEPRMLRALYERGPCSFCRRYVVERLIEINELSESMRAECAFDANEDVRAVAGAG
ncbi:MAG TPA: hypothetical protein VGG72_09885 [Bryobacteraceae bacterium]|jgi:hypothetical protein